LNAEAYLPEIQEWQHEKIMYTNDVPPVLVNCNVKGQPNPYVYWSKVNRYPKPVSYFKSIIYFYFFCCLCVQLTTPNESTGLSDNLLHEFVSNGSILTFNEIDESLSGEYICHAENGLGFINKSMTVRIKSMS